MDGKRDEGERLKDDLSQCGVTRVTKRTNTERRAGVLSPTCCARCTLCCRACRCRSCHCCPHWSWRCTCRHTIFCSHFCRDLLYQEMYSLHPPSVTLDCVDCYRYNHDKLCTKFFLEIHATNEKLVHWLHRFPRSISVHSIFVVKSHNRDATRLCAIATMRRNCATNFHCVSCHPLSWGGTMSTMLSWSQVDALSASCRNSPNLSGSTNYSDRQQFLLRWQYDCGLHLQVDTFQGWHFQSDPTQFQSFPNRLHGVSTIFCVLCFWLDLWTMDS